MILPERVLGKPAATWMWSGVAIGPITVRTCCRNSATSSAWSRLSASGVIST